MKIKPSVYIAMPCYDSVKIGTMLSIELRWEDSLLKVATKKWHLVAIRDIKEAEELTVKYTFYNI